MARSTVRMIALLAAASFAASSPAAAAVQAQTALISPWVALSAFGSTGAGASLCATAAAAAAAGQAGTVGCVLPQIDAPVAAPIADPAPVPAAIPAGAPVATGGLGFLPILLGLAAVAAGAALLAGKGSGNGSINLPPLSPS